MRKRRSDFISCLNIQEYIQGSRWGQVETRLGSREKPQCLSPLRYWSYSSETDSSGTNSSEHKYPEPDSSEHRHSQPDRSVPDSYTEPDSSGNSENSNNSDSDSSDSHLGDSPLDNTARDN